MKKSALGIGVVLVLIVVGLLSLKKTREAPESGESAWPDSIRVGLMLPLTGDNAVYGQALFRGLQLALEEGNSSGGVRGIPFALRVEDTQANAETGVGAFRRLVQIDRVPIVIGGMFSAVTLAVAPIAERSEVVLLSPTSSAVDLTNAGDFIFRIYPSDDFDGNYSAKFARDVLKANTAAVLFLEVSSTTAVADVFVREFTTMGGEVVVRQGHTEGEGNFRTTLIRVAAEDPDVIFLASYLNEMARLLRQRRELAVGSEVLSISTFNDPSIIELAGPAAEGVIFSTPVFDPGSDDSLIATFVRRYTSKHGAEPNIWAGYGYDVFRVAAEALRRADDPLSARQIKDALYGIRGFPGVTGSVSFDVNGDVVKELRMMIVQNQSFVPFQEGARDE